MPKTERPTQETIRLSAPLRDGTAPTLTAVLRSPGNVRWVICGLLFFATMINYMDRQVIGILKPTLTHDLHWTAHGYANIVTAFQFAYAIGYLYGGRLMDKFGVRRGLPWAVFLWSLAAGAHGLVRTVTGFGVARLGLGLAEGGMFPGAIKVVGEWFPVKERATATGVFNSASNIGAIVCPLTVPLLALRFGWPAAFYATGALGLVWLLFWAVLYRDPETHPRLSAGERAYIQQGRPTTPATGTVVSWRSLLGYRATWGYLIYQILTSPVWWFYLFWLPDFIQTRFHLTSVETGNRVAVVYTIAIFGSIGAGALAQHLIGRGWTVNAARKTALLICAICVVPLLAVPLVANSWVAVALVGLAAAAHQGTSANLFTVASDVMPKKAVSSLVGLGGFVSGLASMVTAQAVGLVLTATHNNYTLIFFWPPTMYLFGLLFLHRLVPKIEPVPADLSLEAA